MRHWIDAVRLGERRLLEAAAENVAPRYFMHVTAAKNLRPILKQGLLPNHGGGNYDDTQWVSLDGVYASDEASHLRTYLRAHDLQMNYAILILAVQPGASLPDEDIIVTSLQHAYDAVCKTTGLDPFDSVVDEEDPESIEPGGSFWLEVAQQFHRIAAHDGAVMDKHFVEELVDWWADFELGYGNVGPDEWMEMKDRAVRAYPEIKNPHLGRQHSVRIPGAVGLDGQARIVAAVVVKNDDPTVVFGAVPPSATAMVYTLIRG